MKQNLSINFGMPRTGTTFVEQLMRQTDNFHEKLTEGASLHTVIGTGLFDLANAFARRHIVLVRTWREHEESFASMEAALKRDQFPKFSLDRMREWAKVEVENWRKVVEKIDDHPQIEATLIELNIDHIERKEVERIPGMTDEGLEFFDEKYGTDPVRFGRLQEGDHKLERSDVIRSLPHPKFINKGYYRTGKSK